MGKLKLSSVKNYKKERLARRAARLAPTSSNNQDADLIVSLPCVPSFTELCDQISKLKTEIPGWNIVEATSEWLSLVKVNFFSISSC